MSAHRYWRINITSAHASYVGCREIEFHTSIGGAAVTGGTASASSFYGPESLVPANAFDGTNAEWASDGGAYPQWIAYDYGAGNEQDIVEFSYTARSPAPNQSPSEMQLQWSDNGTDWTTLFDLISLPSWTSAETRSYSASNNPLSSAVEKQAWRINITSVNGGAVIGITEVQMRLTVGGSDECSGGTELSSSVFGSGFEAAKAFDDDTGTIWAAATTSGYIGYIFDEAKELQEVAITARSGGDVAQAPNDFTIEYWDGSGWQVIRTVTDSASWGSLETRSFSFVPPRVYKLMGQVLRADGDNAQTLAGQTKHGQLQKMDWAYRGVPFIEIDSGGVAGTVDTTLDVSFRGTPIALYGDSATISFTAATSTGSTVTATVGVSVDTTVETSSASTVAAEANAVADGDVQVLTKNASTVTAEAGVSVDTTVETSSATSATAITSISIEATAETSSASTAAGALFKPWSVIRTASMIETEYSGVNISSPQYLSLGPVADGNSVVVMVSYYMFDTNGSSNHANVITDSSGNSYTLLNEYKPYIGSSASNQHTMLTYVANDVVGDPTDLVIEFGVNFINPVSHNFTLLSIFGLEVNAEGSPLGLDVVETKSVFGFSNGAAVSTDAFTTTDAGLVVVHMFEPALSNPGANRFEADYTEINPQPFYYYDAAAEASSTETYYSDAAYRVTTGVLTGEVISYSPGNANGSRNFQVVAFKTAATSDTTVSTSSASTTAATGGVGYDTTVETSSASTASAEAEVGWTVTVTCSSASTAAAEASVGVDVSVATSSASTVAADMGGGASVSVTTSSASTVAAEAGAEWIVTVETSSVGGTAAAEAGVDSPVEVTTSSASSAAAEAGVSVDTQAATSSATTAAGAFSAVGEGVGSTASASTVAAVAGVSSAVEVATSTGSTVAAIVGVTQIMSVTTRSGSTTAAEAAVSLNLTGTTRSASTTDAALELELENSVLTRTRSTVSGVLGVESIAEAATSSASSAQAQAGVSLDLSVATSSASSAQALSLAEWLVAVTTANAQTVAAAAGVAVDAVVGTRSGTTAAAQVGVAADSTASTASFSYTSFALLRVGEDSTVTASSVGGTTQAVAEVYDTPEPYSFVCMITMRPAVGGSVEAFEAVSNISERVFPAVAAKPEIINPVSADSRAIPAVAGDADARPL